MKSEWIEREVTGSTMPAYVVEPGTTPRAGIIVIQEIFGIDDAMQRQAQLVADLGYLAIAPNLFHRVDPHFQAGVDEAGFRRGREAAGKVTFPDLVADLTSAGAYVRERLGPDAPIGTWGFCFGGSVAFLSATLPFVSCAVSFYGGQIAKSPTPDRPPMLDVAAQIRAPILFAFGGRDESIPPEEHAAIKKALDARGKTYEFYVYPDQGHAFFREGPEASDAAGDVWSRVKAFFKKHLA